MQFVTVEVTGVEGLGEGVTVGGVVTACASRIFPSATGLCAPEYIVAAAIRIAKLRTMPSASSKLFFLVVARRRSIRHAVAFGNMIFRDRHHSDLKAKDGTRGGLGGDTQRTAEAPWPERLAARGT